MLFNHWLNKINRLKIDRPSKIPFKRLDCAERVSNFDQVFFRTFLDSLTQEDFITYPSYAEYAALETNISKFLSLDKDCISIGTGSDSCIKDLMQVTLTNESEVVALTPCFPMYFIYTQTFNSKFVGVPYQNFIETKFKAYIDLITKNTSLVIFTNPGSPFGYFFKSEELEDFVKYLQRKSILFLIDEAYVEFAPGNCLSFIKKYNNVVISRTFSKAWGAAGCRLGYLLSQKDNIKEISKVKLTYPVNTSAIKFVNYLLENSDLVTKYIKNSIIERDKLCDDLENSGYDVIRSHTNTIHFHQKKGDNSKAIDILNKHNVAFKAGSKKTGTAVRIPGDNRETWIRLSLGYGLRDRDFIQELLN